MTDADERLGNAIDALETPVLLLIFNRADATRTLLDQVRRARPKRLFVSADGPRNDVPGDEEQCQAARDEIRGIDWDCDLQTRFLDQNVGLKIAVDTAIDWFFNHVTEGVILEDDCLPSQSFFWFCEELLRRYRNDERVMQISGSNFLLGRKEFDSSYYFSKLNDIWGWATWRRAWAMYDRDMTTFPQFKQQGRLADYLEDEDMRDWLMSYFEDAYSSGIRGGIWSSRWAYAMCAQNALTIVPSVNLVENVGFLGDGAHRGKSFEPYAFVGRQEMREMIHAPFVLPDREADALRFELIRRTDPRLASRSRRFVRRVRHVTSRLWQRVARESRRKR